MDLASFLESFGRRDWQQVDGGTVRIALIGLGWWTTDRAIPAIDAADHCEATVLVSSDREKARAVVDATPTAGRGLTYDEFHHGEAAEEYNAVYVSTPNALHLPYVESAAELGKHVLCEKPMEASVERAESMVTACERADVHLMVGYRMQTEPTIRRARELVRAGFLGEPAHVKGHMSQRLLELFPEHDQWRLDPELAGSGTSVTDLGIYPINTARFVLEADPVSVTASMHSATDGFEQVPDERASFGIRFEDDTLAACSASQNASRSGRFEIVGTGGRLALEPAFFGDDQRTLVAERDGVAVELSPDPVDQMTEEFDYFADRVLGGGEVGPDGEHGLVDMRTIEAIYESAASGSTVEV